MENVIKNKRLSEQNYAELQKNVLTWKVFRFDNEKNVGNQFDHLKEIYKFPEDFFLIGHVVFVLIVKNVIKNEKFHFTPNLCEIGKKC